MKLQMHSNSLFAILLRSPWWVAALVAVGVFAAVRIFLAAEYAVFAATPFAVIGGYVGWKQLRAPSSRSIAAALERLRAMSWDEFSAAIEQAYRGKGYEVRRFALGRNAGADYELVLGARTTLLACKRWKATRTGIEPLRELAEARRVHEATDCIYVATGEVTAQARAFAAEHNIRVLEGAELASAMRRLDRG
jgi:restriction system protein